MGRLQDIGNTGEREACELVPCPNCRKKLILLPTNAALYDVQCSGCLFRAQVKTVQEKPGSRVKGAGWDIMEKTLKAGYLLPPLIVYYRLQNEEGFYQDIRFFPFVPKQNLKSYELSATSERGIYRMFNYVHMDKLPWLQLYLKHDPNQKAKKLPETLEDEQVDILKVY